MNDLLGRWDVVHTHYMTYADVLTIGGGDLDAGLKATPPLTVLRNLPFAEAQRRVDELGAGYSMHPHDPRRP